MGDKSIATVERERIAQIIKRVRLATTPPWKVATAKEFGDHWPITFGNSSIDGNDYHVCTDHVHASELTGDAKTDAEFIAGARLDIPYLLAVGNNLAELLYGCVLELSYVLENCESGLCTSAKAKDMVVQGMEVLGVKDLSAEKYQEWE